MGNHRLFTCVQQKKAARSIGALGFPCVKTGLPKQGSLLISGSPGNLYRSGKQRRFRLPINLAGWPWLRQHGAGNAKNVQNLLIPLQRMNIEHHRSRRVGVICDVYLSAGHLPDQPGLHRTKQKLAPLSLFSRSFHAFQNPPQLCPAEIGVDQKSCLFPKGFGQASFDEAVAILRGPPALPHDSVVHRLSRLSVPDHRGFPLIGNSDRFDIFIGQSGLQHGFVGHRHLRGPDFFRVVLHPTLSGINLSKLFLGDADGISPLVIDNTPGAGRSLIQG